jgi:outer membrane protein assembly factor BamA
MSTGFYNLKEEYSEQSVQDYLNFYGLQPQNVFRSGSIVPLSVAYIQETTVFREFGPLAGNTLRIGYDYAPKIAGTLSRQTFDIDARYYQRLATSGVLALRFRGFKSTGEYPDYMYFGGNSEMRGYDYLQFIGQSVMFANAELRFPIIEAALTPIGVIGGIRGVFFANIGGGWFPTSGFEFATNRPEPHTPIIGYQSDASGSPFIDVTTGLPIPIYGQERIVQGWRLKDGRASYGVGLETFMLGFPIHFDWAWRSLFNEEWENVLFAANGGSSEFRQAQFAVWIGYDF